MPYIPLGIYIWKSTGLTAKNTVGYLQGINLNRLTDPAFERNHAVVRSNDIGSLTSVICSETDHQSFRAKIGYFKKDSVVQPGLVHIIQSTEAIFDRDPVND